MDCLTKFRAFCLSAANGEKPEHTRCDPSSPGEVLTLLDAASKAAGWLAKSGVSAKSGGRGNVAANGFWFRAGEETFMVAPPSKRKPSKNGVAASSVEAYRAIDARGQTLSVAKAAIALTREHGYTTDSQVAITVGIPASRVSARRAEIESVSGVVVGGVAHYFSPAGRVKCPVTGMSVNGWRLKPAETGQAHLQL